MNLLAQNSGPFICEGGSSEPTKPPWLRACSITTKYGHTQQETNMLMYYYKLLEGNHFYEASKGYCTH